MTTPANTLLVARAALDAGNAALAETIIAEVGAVAGLSVDEMAEHAAIAWELKERSKAD